MRVRRLEITGFKSFADRTVLDFPQGLCGVVGPNGCGKSNVVDAVRWVLGEQSAKTLRGHSMEDVIFNGSAKRKATGLAEVSLVFENNGSVTASQFADLPEIQVTRRLYRSGDSDYFINKVPCRLKDIHQLFMDTGLGNRAYAIIEQGRVAAFIDAKPEDRRLWIEEAAGITRYKNQKKVSLRKMEGAKENLDRLQDILHEVENQMAKLHRQSKKAVVHRDLRGRIRELDLNIASHEYARLHEDLAQHQAEAEAVGAQVLLSNQRVTGQETDLETLRIQVVSAEREIAQAGERRLTAQGAIQKAENDLSLLGREAESQRRLAERFEEERRQLETRLKEQEREQARASRLADESAASLATSRETVDRASQEVREAAEALRDLERAADQGKHTLVDHLSAITQTNNRLSDLERRQAELTQRQEQLVGRREALEAELAALSAGREEAQEQLDALREQLESVDHQLAELSRARQERQQGLSALRQAEHAATRRQAELAAQADAQASALSSYDWAQAGVRKLLAESAKGSLGVEVLGVAAERLGVEPGREALVEAALGADLQAVLVKDGQALKQLAALAAARPDLGRVRALALDELTRPGSSLTPPAGGRPLAEVVRPEPGFEALAGLWAGAGWAETVEEALELAGSLAPGQVLVTAQGERLDRPGAATVGRVNTVSVLSRRNDLKRLQDEAAQAQAALAQAREERQAAEEHLADLEAEHQSLRGARQEQERVLRAAEQALFRAREAQGVKERQLEGLDFDANQIWSELTHVENQLGELAAKAEELAGRTPGLEEALSLAQQGLAEARLALEEARRAEGEVRLAAASAQAQAEQAARESKRLTQEMEAARERLLALSADLQSSRDAITSLTRRRQEQQDQLGGLYAEMDRQEESYRQARELHSQAQMRAGDLEASLKQARAELRKVEAESQELALRIRELGMQRESLCDQVMERCRVDLTTDHQAHLPEGAFDPELSRQKLAKLRQRLNNLGAVNMEAITEFEALKERHEFLMGQRADLEASLEDLRQAIRKINKTSRGLFLQTLEEVNERLTAVFPVLFGGGQATLVLEEGVDPLDAGLYILVELPGKKVKNLEALSGGEKALSAVAVLFALFLIRPAPFCILDEVDAPLDEANAGRFHDLLRQLSVRSQILMVTHNRRTMETMNLLYGVTMEEKGVSKVLAVNLEAAEAQAA